MDNNELMEIKHEEVPGYKKIFYTVFGLGSVYLAGIFLYGQIFISGGH